MTFNDLKVASDVFDVVVPSPLSRSPVLIYRPRSPFLPYIALTKFYYLFTDRNVQIPRKIEPSSFYIRK